MNTALPQRPVLPARSASLPLSHHRSETLPQLLILTPIITLLRLLLRRPLLMQTFMGHWMPGFRFLLPPASVPFMMTSCISFIPCTITRPTFQQRRWHLISFIRTHPLFTTMLPLLPSLHNPVFQRPPIPPQPLLIPLLLMGSPCLPFIPYRPIPASHSNSLILPSTISHPLTIPLRLGSVS